MVFWAALASTGGAFAAPYRLAPVAFSALPGFEADRLDEALRVFAQSCDRPAQSPLAVPGLDRSAFARFCVEARSDHARKNPQEFFLARFQPFEVLSDSGGDAFFTGYYQPEILGALRPSAEFPVPVYGAPKDLVALAPDQRRGALENLVAARRLPDGGRVPFPDRSAIMDGALEHGPDAPKKILFLRDQVDLFLAQVQGSARVRLPDGRIAKLSFAAKNGQPYTGLARVLVERGVAAPADMTMDRLTDWIRAHGTAPGEQGDALLRLNKSFVFFDMRLEQTDQPPRGGAGVALTPLRSIAVDSKIWPYGLPFFIASDMPWRDESLAPFRRLMVAQDTGSGIVGPARADIFFGAGPQISLRAGKIRHHGRMFLLLPRN